MCGSDAREKATSPRCSSDLALAAYERALEPKRLQLIPGGHFDPYTGQFDQASAAALAWFRERLV